MIWVHGGGFIGGLGDVDLFGPDFLVPHNVVLVTFNYRLGALGFLSLNTPEVPGNAGFKDQVAAFQWVQKNIKEFGGDPKNVTIFGQSSGAVSVSLHMLSPLSAGLFHRAIALSGTALNEWVLPFETERRAFVISKLLGFDSKNKTSIGKFLKTVEATSFIALDPAILLNEEQTLVAKTYFYTYAIENNNNGESFLTEDPLQILKKSTANKADFMIGHTKREFQNLYSEPFAARYAQYRELFVPKRILDYVPPTVSLKIASAFEKHYFHGKPISHASTENILDYFSDTGFNYDIFKYLNYLGDSQKNSRYFYEFSAVCARNVIGHANTLNVTTTAGHSDDLFYMFDPKLYNLTISKNSTEYKLVQQFTTLITNFAKYGNPTPRWIKYDKYLGTTHWPQYRSNTKEYLEFGTTAITCQTRLNSLAISLFDNIYKTAGIIY